MARICLGLLGKGSEGDTLPELVGLSFRVGVG